MNSFGSLRDTGSSSPVPHTLTALSRATEPRRSRFPPCVMFSAPWERCAHEPGRIDDRRGRRAARDRNQLVARRASRRSQRPPSTRHRRHAATPRGVASPNSKFRPTETSDRPRGLVVSWLPYDDRWSRVELTGRDANEFSGFVAKLRAFESPRFRAS